MNWYELRLVAENRVPFPYQSSLEDLMGFRANELAKGKQVDGWNADSWLRSKSPEKDGDPEDVLGEHLGLPTFSERLRLALGSIGERDIQYLPIRVSRSTSEEIPGFAIANVITRVPALDYDNSEMLRLSKDKIDPLTNRLSVEACWKEALFSAPLVGHDIVRLVEFWPPVFVSERFAEVFRRGKFTGADLVPVKVT